MHEPRALAAKVGETMFAADRASRDFMQMELLCCEPGRAVMRMTVREAMLNGHDICHGGLIFTLADSTFAFACNSHNKTAVAAGCSIEFLRPGRLGDVLTCEGMEQTLQGRHGIYDMKVSNPRGELVAMFRRPTSAPLRGSSCAHAAASSAAWARPSACWTSAGTRPAAVMALWIADQVRNDIPYLCSILTTVSSR
jgi:acyl-CoA thioesterase